jgi:hypothetical protein
LDVRRRTTDRPGGRIGSSANTLAAVPDFDPQEMVARFRLRAEAVRTRGMPPIEGPERARFREQAQRDFADFAMIGDAEAELVDGILTLRIDLRPPETPGAGTNGGVGEGGGGRDGGGQAP